MLFFILLSTILLSLSLIIALGFLDLFLNINFIIDIDDIFLFSFLLSCVFLIFDNIKNLKNKLSNSIYSVEKESFSIFVEPSNSFSASFISHEQICALCGKTLGSINYHQEEYKLCDDCQKNLINQSNLYDEDNINLLIEQNLTKLSKYNKIIRENKDCISLLENSILHIFKTYKIKIEMLNNVNGICYSNILLLKSEVYFCKALLMYNIPMFQRNKELFLKLEAEKVAKQLAIKNEEDSKKSKTLQEQLKRNEEVASTIKDKLYNRDRFVILKNSYNRGNAVDNYVQSSLKNLILNCFENKCVKCGSSEDLTLDHYWLSKNEGGNFIMKEVESRNLINNTIVLCRKCNAAKSDKSYTDFFSNNQLDNIDQLSILLSEFYNDDKTTVTKCANSSSSYYSSLRKNKNSKSEHDQIIDLTQAHNAISDFKKHRDSDSNNTKNNHPYL